MIETIDFEQVENLTFSRFVKILRFNPCHPSISIPVLKIFLLDKRQGTILRECEQDWKGEEFPSVERVEMADRLREPKLG